MGDAAVLTHRHIFGLKGDVARLVHFIDETTCMYPCGHNIVLYNSETREQELIHGMVHPPVASEGITALAVTPNKRYLAVAERSERGVVNIYDTASRRRRKMLSYAELGSKEVVYVSFSGDSKFCLTQGGAPEWQLVLWTFDRAAKPIAMSRVSTLNGPRVVQADFCPQDSTVVCVTGDGILKFLRVIESQFRPIPLSLKREPQNYLCHCWLPEDRLVAASDSGDLLLFEGFEFRMVLASSPSEGGSVSTMIAYSKGFVCGGAGGTLRIFERSDDVREYFKCSKVFNIEGNSSVMTNLAISSSEENLICATANCQMYTFTLSNTDILKEDSMNFELLATSFHGPGPTGSAQITGLDVCIWKPLVATCGRDKTLRIWNYQERTVELIKLFAEEPLSVALHPSGLYVLAGFPDKLRLMSLLMDDIRCVKELPIKQCRECAFAHGGNVFAVANNALVQVLDTHTCEVIANLRGHNGRVRSIKWAKGDRRLVTCGMDGAVFVWKVREGVKDGEQVVPRVSFACAAASHDLTRIVAVSDGDDRSIREFVATTPLGASGAVVLAKHVVCAEQLGCCELSANERVLFVGTADPGRPGLVQAYALPQWELQKEPQRYQCHSSEVSCLRLSHDGQFLFTGGHDGSLCVFEVHDAPQTSARKNNAGGASNDRGSASGGSSTPSGNNNGDGSATEFTEEILVTKSDLEDKSAQMCSLRNKVDELVLNNEYQLRLKDMKYKERITEISDKFAGELNSDSERYEQLMEDKRRMELEYEDRLRSLEQKHKSEFRDLEQQYDAKIGAEVTRFQQLATEREKQNQHWERESARLVDGHSGYVEELTREYDAKIEEEHDLQRKLVDDKDLACSRHDRANGLVEDDADLEVEEVKQKYEQKLAAERQLTLKLKGENGQMKKKFSSLTKDVEDQKEEIRSLHEKERELVDNIKGLEKDILGHKKEIREREETIADKEKRIYDLKKKNQELEKFKFVLDYKIKELKRQIEPRETEIADMRKQVEEMDMELEQYHKSNSALDLMIGELRLKMDGMQKEINQQRAQITHANAYVTRFRRDLNTAAAGLANHKVLKLAVRELYKEYVLEEGQANREQLLQQPAATGGAANANADSDLQQEYNRQREHLERNVEQLKRKINKDAAMYAKDNARLVDESTVLIDEMNNLRRESHKQKLKQDAIRSNDDANKSQANFNSQNQELAQVHANYLESKLQRLHNMLQEAGAQDQLAP